MEKRSKGPVKQEATWRERMARHAASGQSVEAFCRSESVSSSCFYRWRNLLGTTKNEATAMKPRAHFVDLGTLVAPQAEVKSGMASMVREVASSGIEVRIEIGGGVVLTIARR